MEKLKPFIKCPGGKRRLIPTLLKFVPQHYSSYYELFIGTGSLLMQLQPNKATICDINSDIINCYQVIRNFPEAYINKCWEFQHKNNREFYYKIRDLDRIGEFSQTLPVIRAARFTYLIKNTYNGLIRYNRSLQFNSPYGDGKPKVIVDNENIYNLSLYLKQPGIKILEGDFEIGLKGIRKPAWCYLDPPYHPISEQSFTGYYGQKFGAEEQQRIKNLCDKLTDRGVQILISNSDCPFIRNLYNDSRYEIITIQALRSINCKTDRRNKINELLIHNKYKMKNY